MAYSALQHDYIHDDVKITVVSDAGRLKVGVQVPYWVKPKNGEPFRMWENRAGLVDHDAKGLDHEQVRQLASDYFDVTRSWLKTGGSDVVKKATGEIWYSNRPIKDSFYDYEKHSFAEKARTELNLSTEERASLEGLPYYGMF